MALVAVVQGTVILQVSVTKARVEVYTLYSIAEHAQYTE